MAMDVSPCFNVSVISTTSSGSHHYDWRIVSREDDLIIFMLLLLKGLLRSMSMVVL